MTFQSQSDSTVLFVGQDYDNYRAVNETLRCLGVPVVWAMDVASAKFLLERGGIRLVLCCAGALTFKMEEFLSSMIETPNGAHCVALTLPTRNVDSQDFKQAACA